EKGRKEARTADGLQPGVEPRDDRPPSKLWGRFRSGDLANVRAELAVERANHDGHRAHDALGFIVPLAVWQVRLTAVLFHEVDQMDPERRLGTLEQAVHLGVPERGGGDSCGSRALTTFGIR